MDVDRFARELPLLFDDFPESERPRDPRFAQVLAEVPGLARENNLALLNLAASLLAPGESYVEAGSFRGTSLVAAALDAAGEVVGIDSFAMEGGSREQVEASLRRFDCSATLLEGDVFELVRAGALEGRRVGVWYYDAKHGHDEQLRGLELVEPWLADEALLVVDDADWDDVARAVRDYADAQPRVRRLLDVGGKRHGRPWWWEGVAVLAWRA